MTETNQEPRPEHRPNEALDSITIAAFDADTRIFRTVWHSMTRTPDVAFAALKGDYSCYLSPVRVFVALFSLQIVIAALFGAPVTLTLDSIAGPLAESGQNAHYEAWLDSARTADGEQASAAEINRTLDAWLSIAVWPLTFLASLPFLLLLKAYRPSIPFWGHVQIYMIPTNGSYVMLTIAIAGYALGDLFDNEQIGMAGFIIGMIGAFILYFILMGRLIVRYYGTTALGAALRLAGLVILLPLTMAISSFGHFAFFHWTLESQYGLNVFDILAPSPDDPTLSEGETE